MRYLIIFLLIIPFLTYGQIEFRDASINLDASPIYSGVAMGVADMNGDGLDDVVRFDMSENLKVNFQQSDGSFVLFESNFSNESQWGLCIADANEDGYNDLFVGGFYNGLNLIYFDSTGVDSITAMPNTNIFLQGANFADINNDGALDIYACHDDGLSHVYLGDGNNGFQFDTLTILPPQNDSSDHSGNYSALWTDYDLDGDVDMYLSKCRLGVFDYLDGRRLNQLQQNDGSGNFMDIASNLNLLPYGQSWSSDFADIDNDGDLDVFIINHDKPSVLYENIDGNYVVLSDSTSFIDDLVGVGIQCLFRDFDNDGFVDLLLTGIGGDNMLLNNGDKTFTRIENAYPSFVPEIQSAAVGDLNNDGFLDIVAGFANGYNSPSSRKDRLLLNEGNENNWLKFRLKGTISNLNGIGAHLKLYGDFGVQVREVRSGEGYGISNSLTKHFGIDTLTSVDSLVVVWPSGTRDVICQPAINQTHVIIESCNSACGGIVFEIDTTICSGDSIEFNGSYYSEAGSYEFVEQTELGCDSTTKLNLSIYTIEYEVAISETPPTITVSNDSAQYEWFVCADEKELIDSTIGNVFIASESGSYGFYINEHNCVETSNCFSLDVVNNIDLTSKLGVQVYPNPTSQNLYLNFDALFQHVTTELWTMDGRLIMKQDFYNQKTTQLKIDNLSNGIYLLRINKDGEAASMQLVVE